jgi:transcriptional regulator GlxA family with amidase domain
LPDLWCFHIYQYVATLELDGHFHQIYPGTASVIPPDTKMVYRYGGLSEHCYCHFRMEDSTMDGQVVVSAVQQLGSRSSEMVRRFFNAATEARAPGPRCQALLWDLLWSLTESDEPMEGPRHPALMTATRLIEQNIAQPLPVSEIAKISGVSYSYLSRLFRAEFGSDVIGYIRQRRGQRAEHLLRSSTLSIKSVAASVGISDLAQFNRLIHRTHGCSPTEMRGKGR